MSDETTKGHEHEGIGSILPPGLPADYKAPDEWTIDHFWTIFDARPEEREALAVVADMAQRMHYALSEALVFFIMSPLPPELILATGIDTVAAIDAIYAAYIRIQGLAQMKEMYESTSLDRAMAAALKEVFGDALSFGFGVEHSAG